MTAGIAQSAGRQHRQELRPRSRAATRVNAGRGGTVGDGKSCISLDAAAEVDVLRVEEERLVEASDGFEGRAPGEEARS